MTRTKKYHHPVSNQGYSPMKNQTVIPPGAPVENSYAYVPYSQHYTTNSTPFYPDYAFFTKTPTLPLILDSNQHYQVRSKDQKGVLWGYTVQEKKDAGFQRLITFLATFAKTVRSSVKRMIRFPKKLSPAE